MSYQFNPAYSLDSMRLYRAKVSVRVGMYVLLSNICFWLAIDLYMGRITHVIFECFIFLVCAVLYGIHKRVGFEKMATLFFYLLFAYLCIVCLFDLPEKQSGQTAVPRSQHLYFVAIAMYPYVLFYKSALSLRIVLSSLCLCLFIFFTYSDVGFITPDQLPSSLRYYLAIFSSSLATIYVAIMMYVIHADLSHRDEKTESIRDAMFSEQLELFYQPQVNKTGKVVGAEALLRWKHPSQGIIMPNQFIPYAEKTGAIIDMGKWVLNAACSQLAKWQLNTATESLTLSVNVSAKEFQHPEFVNDVMKIVESHQFDVSKLTLEITETTLMENLDEIIGKISRLRNFGIGFSLDDFGTGYSSLSMLRDLPLSEIKIDRSFVNNITEATQEIPITDVVLTLGESMKIDSVAEGIETQIQWEYLSNKGCRYFQGYLFGKPMDINMFNQFVYLKTLDEVRQNQTYI